MFFTREKKTNLTKTLAVDEKTGKTLFQEKGHPTERFLHKIGEPGKNIQDFARKVLSRIAKEKEILQAVFLLVKNEGDEQRLTFLSGYACICTENNEEGFLIGEGLPGQVAKDGEMINLKSVPEGYLKIKTGLGETSPSSLLIFPVHFEDKLLGVVELASFHDFTEEDEEFFNCLSIDIGKQIMAYIEPEKQFQL